MVNEQLLKAIRTALKKLGAIKKRTQEKLVGLAPMYFTKKGSRPIFIGGLHVETYSLACFVCRIQFGGFEDGRNQYIQIVFEMPENDCKIIFPIWHIHDEGWFKKQVSVNHALLSDINDWQVFASLVTKLFRMYTRLKLPTTPL